MSRSTKPRAIGFKAWGLAFLVVGGGLVAAFNVLGPRVWLNAPLRIGKVEAVAYANWLDQRGADTVRSAMDRYLITSAKGKCPLDDQGAGWSAHWFEADGYGDSVQMRRLRTTEGGWVIKFLRSDPFRAQRHVVLMPAAVGRIRDKYMQLLADELGVVSPEVSFVRVIACGRDLGIFEKQERIDADFLEKRGLAGAALFTQGHDASRPEQLWPDAENDSLTMATLQPMLRAAYHDAALGDFSAWPYLVDADAMAALLILAWVEHGPAAFSSEHAAAYEWSRGRIEPLYRPGRAATREGQGSLMLDFITVAWRNDAIRRRVVERMSRLEEEQWRLKERWSAMDEAWLPLLADGGSLLWAQEEARTIQEGLLARVNTKSALEGLHHELARHAGDATAFDSVEVNRYWPRLDDSATLSRIAQRTKAYVQGDTLVFPRGRYAITEDLVIPFGRTVMLQQGARFEIAQGRSVLVQGPLHVLGTARNPVFIRAQDEARPFGTFAVLGDGGTDVRISGLQISGGSEAMVNGVRFTGMLAIHDAARTELSQCAITASQGEDALNIKGGKVLLQDCRFLDGKADLVDLDYCAGAVERCSFTSGRRDSNGDGLDVSGSRIRIAGCVFERMLDKGISAGEASQVLVTGCRFVANRLAIASKDLSIVHVDGCDLIRNEIAFGAYRKKPIYGGARILRYGNRLDANSRDEEADELSAISAQARLEDKVLKLFEQP